MKNVVNLATSYSPSNVVKLQRSYPQRNVATYTTSYKAKVASYIDTTFCPGEGDDIVPKGAGGGVLNATHYWEHNCKKLYTIYKLHIFPGSDGQAT